ncbi:MAG: hypothetical protein EOM03_07165 [Clostridia bacterium]|nr:hypothetical protein [Clostridia bacterium]
MMLKKSGGFIDITVTDARETLRQAFDKEMFTAADIFKFKLKKISIKKIQGVTIPDRSTLPESSQS